MLFIPSCFHNCCHKAVVDSNSALTNSNNGDYDVDYHPIRNLTGLQTSDEEMQTFSVTSQPQQRLRRHSDYIEIMLATRMAAQASTRASVAVAAEMTVEEVFEEIETIAETQIETTVETETGSEAKIEADTEAAAEAMEADIEAQIEAMASETAKTNVEATAQPQFLSTTVGRKKHLKKLVERILSETNIIYMRPIPGSEAHKIKATLSVAQAMNEDLSQSSLAVAQTLLDALNKHPEFKQLGFEGQVVVVGKNCIPRTVKETTSVKEGTYMRAYLTFSQKEGGKALILDVCTTDFLSHNEMVFGTWAEVNSFVRHHLTTRTMPSSHQPIIKEHSKAYQGAFRKGEAVFPKDEGLAQRLDHYLTTGHGDLNGLNWRVMIAHYGIPPSTR